MHILSGQQFSTQDEQEIIDLNHPPADIVVMSFADTELSLLDACMQSSDIPYTLRLVNLAMLSHPMSVDMYCEKTLSNVRCVVVRVLGGTSYWKYGLDSLSRLAHENNFTLIALSGDDKWDSILASYSNIPSHIQHQLHAYFIESGKENITLFLQHIVAIINGTEFKKSAKPLIRAGYYHPHHGITSLDNFCHNELARPTIYIIFYRALLQSGMLKPIDEIFMRFQSHGITALPIFITSLKEQHSKAAIYAAIQNLPADAIINTTAFAASKPGSQQQDNILAQAKVAIFQVIISQSSLTEWSESLRGLNIRDLAMHVVLPELDGRISTTIISFKERHPPSKHTNYQTIDYVPHHENIDTVCKLIYKHIALKRKVNADKKIVCILPNYPNRDGRLANGVGLDTPQSAVEILTYLHAQGYVHQHDFTNGNALIRALQEVPTNAHPQRPAHHYFPLEYYQQAFAKLPQTIQDAVIERWKTPEEDPFFCASHSAFGLPIIGESNIYIAIQPSRGYHIDIEETYHDSALIPPHNYFAFYFYIRENLMCDAVIHLGKHGNLEWLPGKALALSNSCYPEMLLGATPHFYPFIVNDPGEGSQAKRRNHAVIIDHLTPPLTQAGSYGMLQKLEHMIDEYHQALSFNDKRAITLKESILEFINTTQLDDDFALQQQQDDTQILMEIDKRICDIKELQIRDGLHIFGRPPPIDLQADFVLALLRNDRPQQEGKHNMSLIKAITKDANCTCFIPFETPSETPIYDAIHPLIQGKASAPLRHAGKLLDAIEQLALDFLQDKESVPDQWLYTHAVLQAHKETLFSLLNASTKNELESLRDGLNGQYVYPGPSGAPSRGRLDVLPTGRNFYSIDTRIVPTQAAYTLGFKSAQLLLQRHVQEHGTYPKTLGLSVWGTANMRTGGDDLAQAIALLGVRPVRDEQTARVTGFDIIPVSTLGRPRVDVTLRVSGFFRDAFPDQIAYFDKIVQAIAQLDEDPHDNPLRYNIIQAAKELQKHTKLTEDEAFRQASYRIFSTKPGSYGAGLQVLMDNAAWDNERQLVDNWIEWGGYAYGDHIYGSEAKEHFSNRIKDLQVVVHNQDNREHDIFDSDDYYQFQGGMVMAKTALSGEKPTVYHNDHSKPEHPTIKTLEEEVTRVIHGRVLNPKWIKGVMRHGYKGAFEIAATIDYIYAYAVTTKTVKNHHFDKIYQTYILDPKIQKFFEENNPHALSEIANTLLQAQHKEYWKSLSNTASKKLELLTNMDYNPTV